MLVDVDAVADTRLERPFGDFISEISESCASKMTVSDSLASSVLALLARLRLLPQASCGVAPNKFLLECFKARPLQVLRAQGLTVERRPRVS